MKFGLMICKILSVAALTVGANTASAQSVESIFLGGSRYVYDIYRGETVEESVARLPNKLIVLNSMLPQMAKIYKDCARETKFRGRVRAVANVYSSHFSTVTLERHPSMSADVFETSVACVKSEVTQASASRVSY